MSNPKEYLCKKCGVCHPDGEICRDTFITRVVPALNKKIDMDRLNEEDDRKIFAVLGQDAAKTAAENWFEGSFYHGYDQDAVKDGIYVLVRAVGSQLWRVFYIEVEITIEVKCQDKGKGIAINEDGRGRWAKLSEIVVDIAGEWSGGVQPAEEVVP